MGIPRHRVLFVDDDPAILDGLRRSLRRQFDIETAKSAQEALFLVSTKGPFAAVVADIIMPEMDGVELLARMAQQSPGTARLALSACVDPNRYRDALDKGQAFRFLSKPCPVNELVEQIGAAIAEAGNENTSSSRSVAVAT